MAAAVIGGLALATAGAASAAPARIDGPRVVMPLVQNVHWEWHHHHRIWVSDHHHEYRY